MSWMAKPVACLLAGLTLLTGAWAGEKPASVVERLAIAKDGRNVESETRLGIVLELGRVTSKEDSDYGVGDKLLDLATKDSDRLIRQAAIIALGTLQNTVASTKTKYVKPFTDILKNKEEPPAIKKSVIAVFRKTMDVDALNDKAAFNVLFEIAKNKAEPNMGLRGEAIEAIGDFPVTDSLTVLADVISENEPFFKEKAASALLSLLQRLPESGDKINIATVNRLTEMAGDKTLPAAMRAGVLKVLGRLIQENIGGAKQSLPLIVSAAKNPAEPVLAKAAIEALGMTGLAEAVPPLGEAWKNFFDPKKPQQDEDMRQAVARALQKIIQVHSKRASADLTTVREAVNQLVAMLRSREETLVVKGSAVYALAYLDAKKFERDRKIVGTAVYELITELTYKESAPIHANVVRSLEWITSMDFGTDHNKWTEWEKKAFPENSVPKPKKVE